MRVVVEFGELKSCQVGCRIRTVDNGKWRGARNARMLGRFESLLREMLAKRLTDEDFRTGFMFYIEPHRIDGVAADGKGTCDINFVLKKNCGAAVNYVGLKVYETIFESLAAEKGGDE